MPLKTTNSLLKTDLDVLLRFQDLMLSAVEGSRDEQLDREYKELRSALLKDTTYAQVVPSFVRRNRDLGSLWPTLKSFSPQWEPRRVEVRRQFEDALEAAERIELFGRPEEATDGYDSSAWTGAVKGVELVRAVKTLLPIAQSAVGRLIELLEAPGHNGGPPLDERANAIEALRHLHKALGELLVAADEGKLDQTFNSGLPVEAARYAKRAAKALRDDPIPYALSATVLAIMTACGMPGIGGYLAGVAVSMKKK